MPATIFLIGLLSVVLLFWVGQVNEKLQDGAELVDAVMDVQINVAIGHLLAEEAFREDVITAANVNDAIPRMEQSIKLIDAVLAGGIVEHGYVSEPLEKPELRALAQTAKSRLTEFRDITVKRLRGLDGHNADPAFEENVHMLFKEIITSLQAIEYAIEVDESLNRKKSRRLFRVVLAAWASIVILATGGLLNREKHRKRAEDALFEANERLFSQSEELLEHRERLAEQVEKRTAELKESESQCRSLSSRLLDAQETERKRISMELHDGLGQALNALKLHMGAIVRQIGPGQEKVKEECDRLMEYMDQTIEDVRRLSMNLSPTILEDLGLTSALRWLVNNLADTTGIAVSIDMDEVDSLLPKRQWITIYRVAQEAFTNIGKHAQADNVSLVVMRNVDTVIFSVVDDGIGFDPALASKENAHEKGLGLTTMDERVKMMGGTMRLASRKGGGTHITFRIPIVEQEN